MLPWLSPGETLKMECSEKGHVLPRSPHADFTFCTLPLKLGEKCKGSFSSLRLYRGMVNLWGFCFSILSCPEASILSASPG